MAASRNSSGFKILLCATIALICFVGAIVSGFVPGLGDDPDTPPNDGEATNGTQLAAGFDPTELQFKKWPVPTAALILTGEQHGYIEPCGCTENQSGGVSRRGDLVRQLGELNWQTAGLDVGGLVQRDRIQSQMKFTTMTRALQDLNYKALALGVEDLKLKPDFLLSQHMPDDPKSLAFLCANAVFYETADLGTPGHAKVFELGGLKIGVTAVIGSSFGPELANVSDIAIAAPADVLPATIKALTDEGAELKVLMAHGTLEEAKKLAADFSEFDVVLATGGPEDPDGVPMQVENTIVLNVGKKGKHCGVLAIYPDGNPKFRFELVQLDRDRFGDTPGMIEHMRQYQNDLEAREVIAMDSPVGHPSGATYVGSDACADCHEEEYDIWKKSPHASAFASLDPTNERHGHERLKGIARMFDPECVCCHTTGWNPKEVFRYRSGFINAAFAADEEERRMSPLLKGSGCENCHGPGSRHIELINEGEDDAQAAKLMRFTIKQAKASEGCYKCHDLDNSPNFDFDEYWPKIAH